MDVVREANMDLVISPHSAEEFRDSANGRVREPPEQLEGLEEDASSTSSGKSLASTSTLSYSPESDGERAMEPDDNDGDKHPEKDESDRSVKSEGKRVRFEAKFQDVNRTVEVTHSESESEDENKRTSRDNTKQSSTLEYDTLEVENPKEKSKETIYYDPLPTPRRLSLDAPPKSTPRKRCSRNATPKPMCEPNSAKERKIDSEKEKTRVELYSLTAAQSTPHPRIPTPKKSGKDGVSIWSIVASLRDDKRFGKGKRYTRSNELLTICPANKSICTANRANIYNFVIEKFLKEANRELGEGVGERLRPGRGRVTKIPRGWVPEVRKRIIDWVLKEVDAEETLRKS